MRNLALITNVRPNLGNEQYFIKRVAGSFVTVQANIFADGMREISASLHYKTDSDEKWEITPMSSLGNDFWAGQFKVVKEGNYQFKIEAWVGNQKDLATYYHSANKVRVGRPKELFGTWYELFPRSTSPDSNRAGTLKDCENLVPRIAKMGFDVMLLPPIYPIGFTKRKGKDNSLHVEPDDVGSPWSVGNQSGGHTTLNPELGNFQDFKNLTEKALANGIEIALDMGLRCSPDHPLVSEHPDWFHASEDGSIITEEAPPFSYSDIINFNFECDDWKGLWEEIKSIALFWAEKGIKIFYTNTPHHKPFAFWNWLIKEVQTKYPEVIFVSGAITRPIIMNELSKAGFTQSFTHFIWQNTKQELKTYFSNLINSESREYIRPNLFTNTPDILPKTLMDANENAFMIRYALAATLSSNCGIHGPAFELMENRENPAGKEEYIQSEKYQVRHYDWATENRLMHFITKLNQIRKEHPALQNTYNLTFTKTDNDQLLSYIKISGDNKNIIWSVVNLDPDNKQSGYVEVPKELLGIRGRWLNLKVLELLSGETYHWFNDWNYVELKPHISPIHVLHVAI